MDYALHALCIAHHVAYYCQQSVFETCCRQTNGPTDIAAKKYFTITVLTNNFYFLIYTVYILNVITSERVINTYDETTF